jgi:histidinol-phosphate aminotransferase
VRDLPAVVPFVGPETIARRRGRPFKARLGANESVFGPSPQALAAMREAVTESWCYGDPEGMGLRGDLAAQWGVPEEAVTLGAGIDGLLPTLLRLVVEPGTPVVTSLGAYPTFNYHVVGLGGVLHKVPYKDDAEDLDGLLDAVRAQNAPLVYLCNPDNPMGTWHNAEAIAAFLRALPAHTMLMLDEAYAEFAPDEAVPPVVLDDPRLVRLRTFSKVYGMAGQRVGYAIAHPDVITAVGKIRNHFEVNRVAQIGARAALADRDFTAEVITAVETGRRDYGDLAADLGFAAVPSATNFVAIDVGGPARARWLLKALEARDVFIRMPGAPPLDRCIRVTVGTTAAREVFAEALRDCAKAMPSEAALS